MHSSTPSVLRVLALASVVSALPASVFAQSAAVITGPSAFTDYTQEHPGVRRKITLADLPQPKQDESVDNGPSVVPRPEGAWPVAPAGFKVEMYAQGFKEPRLMRTAPNGDIFLADSHGGKIIVLRGVGPDGKAQTVSTFASDLDLPFGIAFYPSGPNPKWVYVGNTKTVVRFPYKSGDLKQPANLRRSSRSFLALPNSAAEATGRATWSFVQMARRCLSLSVLPPTPTTRTRTPANFTAPTCSNSPPKASL